MARHNDLGKAGEEAAMEYLIRKGYTIRERNWKCNHLELDLVVEKNGGVIFVEVKTRTNDDFNPALVFSEAKGRKVIMAGKGYLRKYAIQQLSIQIDVIFVTGTPDNFKIQHVENAISPHVRSVSRRRL